MIQCVAHHLADEIKCFSVIYMSRPELKTADNLFLTIMIPGKISISDTFATIGRT